MLRVLWSVLWIVGNLLLILHPSLAQIKVQASVDNRTVALHQFVRFRLEIENAPFFSKPPDPPTAEGLTLAQPFPSSSRSISIINGRMQQVVAYEWFTSDRNRSNQQ